jgi:hypothetical protein
MDQLSTHLSSRYSIAYILFLLLYLERYHHGVNVYHELNANVGWVFDAASCRKKLIVPDAIAIHARTRSSAGACLTVT